MRQHTTITFVIVTIVIKFVTSLTINLSLTNL